MDPEKINIPLVTWAALLARWVDFARSSLALPATLEGQRLRQSVPDIIMLQAVWMSLGEVDQLEPAERALGLDRAGVLIQKHSQALRARWAGESLPDAIRELMTDASQRLQEASKRRGDLGGA